MMNTAIIDLQRQGPVNMYLCAQHVRSLDGHPRNDVNVYLRSHRHESFVWPAKDLDALSISGIDVATERPIPGGGVLAYLDIAAPDRYLSHNLHRDLEINRDRIVSSLGNSHDGMLSINNDVSVRFGITFQYHDNTSYIFDVLSTSAMSLLFSRKWCSWPRGHQARASITSDGNSALIVRLDDISRRAIEEANGPGWNPDRNFTLEANNYQNLIESYGPQMIGEAAVSALTDFSVDDLIQGGGTFSIIDDAGRTCFSIPS